MATTYACDGGCGESTRSQANYTEFGIVVARCYCDHCAELVQKYENERDAEQIKLATAWDKKLGTLKSQFLKKCPNGVLPDD